MPKPPHCSSAKSLLLSRASKRPLSVVPFGTTTRSACCASHALKSKHVLASQSTHQAWHQRRGYATNKSGGAKRSRNDDDGPSQERQETELSQRVVEERPESQKDIPEMPSVTSKMSSWLKSLRKKGDETMAAMDKTADETMTASRNKRTASPDDEQLSPAGEATPTHPFRDNTSKGVPPLSANEAKDASEEHKAFHVFEDQEHKTVANPPPEKPAQGQPVQEDQVHELINEVKKIVQDVTEINKKEMTKSTPPLSAEEKEAKEHNKFHIFEEQEGKRIAEPAKGVPAPPKSGALPKAVVANSSPKSAPSSTSNVPPAASTASVTTSKLSQTASSSSSSTQEVPFNDSDLQQAQEIMDSFENAHISIYKEPKTFTQRINHLFYQFTLYTKYSLYAAAVFLVLYLFYKYKRFQARLKNRYDNIRGEVERRVTNKVAHFFSEEGLVGLCVSVMMNEEPCQDISLGFSNMEQFSKCDTAKTLMSLGLGGINEALIVYGIGRMVEEGLLNLDRVSKIQLDENGTAIEEDAEHIQWLNEGDAVDGYVQMTRDSNRISAEDEERVALETEVGGPEKTNTSEENEGGALDPEVDLELEALEPSKIQPVKHHHNVSSSSVSQSKRTRPKLTVSQTLRRLKDSSRSQQEYYTKLYCFLSKETQTDFNAYLVKHVLEKRFGVYHIFPNNSEMVIPHRASAYRRESSSGILVNCPATSVAGNYVATTRDLCLLGQGFQSQPLLAATFAALGTVLAPSVNDWNALSNFDAHGRRDPFNAGSSALLISPEFHLVVASASNSSDVNLIPLASQIAEEYAQISAIDEEYHKGTWYHLSHRALNRVKRWFGSGGE
uniref:Uncharacterized protein n=1 Tax=Percolomonas cosmopolitus TaxID=63605 RepID=A0A7S1PI91_9EUKA|mmetsp:Transcript_742/g.2459  ORF Transcript_742/g.2459 Transcript_742/m.2459 type:complete len:839 (+) Transcript_742:368-2884(+)|eukprot:CAMPEP_0117450280 /NCGR_PEP_ID=MMETSP0759-20121206/8384_1 /TAXON_ID=63605 /ORGANISM="Percolomonas cosmopolitus, Strain WS" /LENGTH=838 /DNA_ID=CAMNT_0005242791 /DNA_START=351 /DNA_END=2867 /DNA_ORIENTATION=-